MKKGMEFGIFLAWILISFLMYPAFTFAANSGTIRSSSTIPDLQLQIPIDKITNSGSNQLQGSGTTPSPSVSLPVEKITKITGAELAKGSGLGTYIASMYAWLVAAISMLAVLFMMIGGIIWLTAAGSSQKVGKAKKLIMDSLWGLLIALGSYLLLSTLNRDLVELRLITPSGTSGVQQK